MLKQVCNLSTSWSKLSKTVPKNLKGKSVSSQLWLKRQLTDPYVEKARKYNYRCRSAFKLLEIDDKYHIIQPGHIIIDCGCAPGSWSQVAVQRSNADGANERKPKGTVIGVDLLQMFPLDHATLIGNTNFTTDEGQKRILDVLGDRKKVNVVLSDMAPNATGVRMLDHENIIKLCYSVLRFAVKMSEVDGSVLMKTWACGEVPTLERDMKKFYKTVKIIKPDACRTESSEQYLFGKGFVGLEDKS